MWEAVSGSHISLSVQSLRIDSNFFYYYGIGFGCHVCFCSMLLSIVIPIALTYVKILHFFIVYIRNEGQKGRYADVVTLIFKYPNY